MSSAQEISSQLKELVSFIENAHEQLSSGTVVDLSRLDDEVARICEETLQLSPEEANNVQPAMAEMISKLEALGVALKEFQDGLRNKNGLN